MRVRHPFTTNIAPQNASGAPMVASGTPLLAARTPKACYRTPQAPYRTPKIVFDSPFIFHSLKRCVNCVSHHHHSNILRREYTTRCVCLCERGCVKAYWFVCIGFSVTRLGDLLDFGQVFKAFSNYYFDQISHILKQILLRCQNL